MGTDVRCRPLLKARSLGNRPGAAAQEMTGREAVPEPVRRDYDRDELWKAVFERRQRRRRVAFYIVGSGAAPDVGRGA